MRTKPNIINVFKKKPSNVKHEISQQIQVWFQIYANVTKTSLSNVSIENVLQLKRTPNWRQPEMEVNLKYKKGIVPKTIGQIFPNFYTKAYANNFEMLNIQGIHKKWIEIQYFFVTQPCGLMQSNCLSLVELSSSQLVHFEFKQFLNFTEVQWQRVPSYDWVVNKSSLGLVSPGVSLIWIQFPVFCLVR